jgi:hypothetical protein
MPKSYVPFVYVVQVLQILFGSQYLPNLVPQFGIRWDETSFNRFCDQLGDLLRRSRMDLVLLSENLGEVCKI